MKSNGGYVLGFQNENQWELVHDFQNLFFDVHLYMFLGYKSIINNMKKIFNNPKFVRFLNPSYCKQIINILNKHGSKNSPINLQNQIIINIRTLKI